MKSFFIVFKVFFCLIALVIVSANGYCFDAPVEGDNFATHFGKYNVAIQALEDDKSDKTNVIEKDSETAFTPTEDTHPTNKGYVDTQVATKQDTMVSDENYVTDAEKAAITTNSAKETNVTTNLSEGTATETTVDVNSSDGTNATLVSASTTRAGLLTKAKFDEIVLNNAFRATPSTAITAGTNISWDGNTLNVESGAGTIDTTGTITALDIPRFSDSDTLEGLSYQELIDIIETQDWDFSNSSELIIGPLEFTPSATFPTEGGVLSVCNSLDNSDDGALSMHLNDEDYVYLAMPKTSYEAGTDGQAVILDTGTNKLDFATVSATVEDIAYDSSWEDNTAGTSKATLYDKFEAMTTLIANLQQTIIDAGIKIFTCAFTSPTADSWHNTAPDIQADVTVSGINTISSVEWELNDSGSFVTTGLTSDDGTFDESAESITLTGLTGLSQGANVISLKSVSDGESSAETTLSFNYDNILPVIVAGADSTHDGTSTFNGTLTLTETNIANPACTFSLVNGTPTSGSMTGTYPNYTTPDITPDGTDDITITYAATDLAGNSATGTDLVQEFAYDAGTTYLVNQNFETATTGYDNSETWTELSAGVEAAYTTTVLRGSQSFAITGTGNYDSAYTTFTAQSTVYGFVRFRVSAFSTNNFLILDGAGSPMLNINMIDGGSIRINHGSANDTVSGLSADTEYFIFYDYTAGTGSDGVANMSIYDSCGGSLIGSAAITTGTSTADVDKLTLMNHSTNVSIFDQVVLSDTTIGATICE